MDNTNFPAGHYQDNMGRHWLHQKWTVGGDQWVDFRGNINKNPPLNELVRLIPETEVKKRVDALLQVVERIEGLLKSLQDDRLA